jgi:hypothetical protein
MNPGFEVGDRVIVRSFDGREELATIRRIMPDGTHWVDNGHPTDLVGDPTYSTPRNAYLALFRSIKPGPMPDHLWRIEFRRVERDNG